MKKLYLLFILAYFFLSPFVIHAFAKTETSPCVVTAIGTVAPGANLPAECATTGPAIPQNYPSDLKKGLIDTFGITMNGYDDDHLKWAWNQFSSISNTNFDKLVKGAVLEANGCGGNANSTFSCQASCSKNGEVGVYAKNYTITTNPEQYFRFIISHELGHFIRNCNTRELSFWTEHDSAQDKEGAISYYGGHAGSCSGSDNYSEDYADTIAYYLNKNSGNTSNGFCGPQSPVNPYFQASPMTVPLHLMVAKGILVNGAVDENKL